MICLLIVYLVLFSRLISSSFQAQTQNPYTVGPGAGRGGGVVWSL